MKPPALFKPWIANRKWALWVALFILLISALMQFGLFALNQQYVIGYFGAQPEDIAASIQLTYVGIVAALPIQHRFLQYFERRTYMLCVVFSGILLSIASMYTTNVSIFMVLRFLTGLEVCLLAASSQALYLASLPPQKAPVIGSAIFYGGIISNTVITGIFTAWITENYDWAMVYKVIIACLVVSVLVLILILRPVTGMKKYPLYQIDWLSFVITVIIGVSMVYTMIYGTKYYWFADPRIQLSAFIAGAGFILLFYRQTRLKRPYLNLVVFKVPTFVLGIIMLIVYYGLKDSINLIYAYTGSIVKWDTYSIMLLATINLCGFLFSNMLAAALILKQKVHPKMLFIAGFSMMAIFHVWVGNIFTPDMSFNDLATPVFFQGLASGALFTPIVLFILIKVPPFAAPSGIALAAMTRFTTILNSFAGFYTMQLYYNQLNKETFLGHLTNTDSNFTERIQQFVQLFRSKGFTTDQANALANVNVNRALTVQSQLITNLQVFKVMLLISIVMVVILVAAPTIARMVGGIKAMVRNRQAPALK